MRDSGVGMDARTREHIFEPFFTTKDVGKGTGLGLATVYGIVKQLGGYIWVSSQVGDGTTFTLFFPESDVDTQPAAVSTATAVVPPLATAHEVVLVVEDEVGVRTLVTRTLARHGYRVLDAATAHEGLTLAAQHGEDIHLVISDVVMPIMSGPEMVGKLRETRPDAKVLYMSGYAGDVMTRGGMPETNAQLLEKPFTAHDLLRTVRELLDAR
jgi:CheY-like chemotaxis protein